MKKTLRNIIGGLGLLALVSGCTGMGAAMQTSNDPRTRLIGTIMYHESAHNERMEEAREGRSQVNVNTQGVTYNSEERAILNQVKSMPRVVCLGDVDNDGDIDGTYYDGKGNRFGVVEVFRNERNALDLEKSEEYFKREFHYREGDIKIVPQNTLIIWYQK
jgi:hypothetical protein